MRINDQKGSILVYSLLLMAFTIIISLAMQNAAIMEYKMSLYEHRANQARELAESASWIVLEGINEILRNDFVYEKELPGQIRLPDESPVFSEQQNMRVSQICLEKQDAESCIYSYSSQGNYRGAEKILRVKVKICFEEYYGILIDADGNYQEIFDHRRLTDRGRFIAFEETSET